MSVLEQFDLTGRVAVVTGGGRGLGRAAALALSEAGAAVAIGGRDEATLAAAAADITAATSNPVLHHVIDVGSPDSVATFFDAVQRRHPELHVLINNAGTEHSALAHDTDLAAWSRVLDVNLTGAFACIQHFLAAAVDHDSSIVNITSIGSLVGIPTQVSYCASKGGVLAMTRTLALELARRGIRVNALAPGYLRTDMPAEVLSDPQAEARLLKRIPQRWIPEPDEIGPTIVYLASPASRFMTGASISLDGGYTAQ